MAFTAAMNYENVITRVLGFVFLIISGAALLMIGLGHGTIIDILLGIAAIGAAGYSWWYTRN